MEDPLRKLESGAYKALAYEEDVRTDLKLLEVDEGVLQELLQHGVVIKGGADAEAVLVTRSKTFAIKYVETTNLQLLVAPGSSGQDEPPGSPAYFNDQGVSATQALRSPAGLQTQVARMRDVQQRAPLLVTATTKAHLELSEVRPQLGMLHTLLSERPYGLPEDAFEETVQGQSSEQLHSDPEQDDLENQPQAWKAGSAEEQQARVESRKRNAERDPELQHKQHRKRQRHGLYSFEDLLAQVQASESQVRTELSALQAIELDGYWRLVDAGYMGQLLELCILSAQAEGWPLTALPLQSLCKLLAEHEYRPELIRHCLAVHGNTDAASGADAIKGATAAGLQSQQPEPTAAVAPTQSDGMEPECMYCLDTTKVCRYFAQKVLAQHQQQAQQAVQADGWVHNNSSPHMSNSLPMAMRQFMAQWQAAVPAGVQPDIAMLHGLVLTTGKGPEAQVRLFPVSSLPTEPRERFAMLFTVSTRWEATDLEPYLVGLQAPGQTAGALLLKYARASQPKPDGPVYYTAR